MTVDTATAKCYLKALGYDDEVGPVNGSMDKKTATALQDFRTNNGINPKAPAKDVMQELQNAYRQDDGAKKRIIDIIGKGDKASPEEIKIMQGVVSHELRLPLQLTGKIDKETEEATALYYNYVDDIIGEDIDIAPKSESVSAHAPRTTPERKETEDDPVIDDGISTKFYSIDDFNAAASQTDNSGDNWGLPAPAEPDTVSTPISRSSSPALPGKKR